MWTPQSTACAARIESLASARVYIDSNILIYFVEDVAGLGERTRALFGALHAGHCEIFTSEITLGECLFRPHRDRNAKLIAIYEDFFGAEDIANIPVHRDIIRAAAALAAVSNLKMLDAIHIASAVAGDCAIFVTNDARIRSVEGLRVLQFADVDETGASEG